MKICVYMTDGNAQSSMVAEAHVDSLRLMIMAESREDEARRRGRTWTAGAIPFFAQELITALQEKRPLKQIEMEAANAALAAWLYDSIYDGVGADTFARSDLNFTIMPGGAVKYERVPATASEK